MNLCCDLDLEHSNQIFAEDTPVYNAVQSVQVWLQMDQLLRRYSRNSQILIIYALEPNFVQDTPPCDDIPPNQVWLKMVQWFRRYHPDKLGHTDKVISIYRGGSYNKRVHVFETSCITEKMTICHFLIWDDERMEYKTDDQCHEHNTFYGHRKYIWSKSKTLHLKWERHWPFKVLPAHKTNYRITASWNSCIDNCYLDMHKWINSTAYMYTKMTVLRIIGITTLHLKKKEKKKCSFWSVYEIHDTQWNRCLSDRPKKKSSDSEINGCWS